MFNAAIPIKFKELAARVFRPIVRSKELDGCISLVLRNFLETFEAFEYRGAGLVMDAENPTIASRFVNEDDEVAMPVNAWG
jgi:hypothetical protein